MIKELAYVAKDHRPWVARIVADLMRAEEHLLKSYERTFDVEDLHVSDIEERGESSYLPLLTGIYLHQRVQDASSYLPEHYRVYREHEAQLVVDVYGVPKTVTATADLLLHNLQADQKVIIELKFVGESNFRRLRMVGKPLPHHEFRTRVYMIAHNCDRSLIVYENRDTFERLVFLLLRSEVQDDVVLKELADKLEKKFALEGPCEPKGRETQREEGEDHEALCD